MGLGQYHGFGDGVRWRITAQGVDVEGSGVERTRGAPATVSRVWQRYADEINRAARQYRVPVPLIIATICTESGGDPDALRREPKYRSDEETPHQVSAGLMQTLLSTARETLRMSVALDWLYVPGNSITAGTAYIAKQSAITKLDPPLVAAAYNAGGLRAQTGAQNRWKLMQYRIGTGEHVDRFVKFYNDAMAVLAGAGAAAAVPQETAGRSAATGPVTLAEPRIEFATHARAGDVSDYSRTVLRDILRSARLEGCLVSSTSRTPDEQARVMYDNLVRQGVEAQRALYKRPGNRVIDVYVRETRANREPPEVRRAMAEEIRQIGPTNVSRHACDLATLNVFDVAPSSVSDRRGFEQAVRADRRVAYFLTPPKDPGYHLEIPQRHG